MSLSTTDKFPDLSLVEVQQADEARRTAMLSADAAALEVLLADDTVWVHASAGQDTKTSFIGGFSSGRLRCFKLNHTETRIRLLGPAAIMTGHVEMDVEMSGTRRVAENLFVAVWARTTHGLQLCHWQSTRVPPPSTS